MRLKILMCPSLFTALYSFSLVSKTMASNPSDDMNLNGPGPVTSWHAFLGEENKKKKKRKGSNQENFKRLVVTGGRKWSELSDGERSHFLSLATGKEERMTRRLDYKKRH